jgi:hypothetical protein
MFTIFHSMTQAWVPIGNHGHETSWLDRRYPSPPIDYVSVKRKEKEDTVTSTNNQGTLTDSSQRLTNFGDRQNRNHQRHEYYCCTLMHIHVCPLVETQNLPNIKTPSMPIIQYGRGLRMERICVCRVRVGVTHLEGTFAWLVNSLSHWM